MRRLKLHTLVLYARYTDKISYYEDWLYAFDTHPDFLTSTLNVCNRESLRFMRRSIQDYDLIVILHSVNADTLDYINPYRGMFKDRRGKLLSFVGNEVNLPRISLKAKLDFLKEISADFIATQLPLEAGEWLYADCRNSRVVALPHALNPEAFRPVIPGRERPIDIGARSQKYWPCLGDNERNNLFAFFSQNRFDPPLKLDIETGSRFDRAGWARFLNQCKGTISNEAGSFYLERDDATVGGIQSYVKEQQGKAGSLVVSPDSLPERLWRLVPGPVKLVVKAPLSRLLKSLRVNYYSDAYEGLDFTDTFERFFRGTPRCPVYSKAISSRHFDAIGTKTCQVMLRGRFNGILRPDEHYVCLEHDLSNATEAVARFKDEDYRQAMVDRTYEYVMDCHTYRHRVDEIRDLLE